MAICSDMSCQHTFLDDQLCDFNLVKPPSHRALAILVTFIIVHTIVNGVLLPWFFALLAHSSSACPHF
ncbi:hypothetical protein BDQ12DRAFT_692950 [Crucibulum laeve]|uniref:Uncharacterized protein n=1 Tax=Crucibulum laeve TaxID=68775 RepID=A0A5C3LHM9_9AGAR|nr:hypothetical protein BDQ12DRAFT_692950 [Crucibulum laeve]